MDKHKVSGPNRKYQVALSFAGEDREYVEKVAEALRTNQIRVFYDRYEEADLWGKDLYPHLQDVYTNQAEFTVMFISKHYARKLWTNHERESAQARAFEEKREYILPARFDDSQIPGIPDTVAYVDLRSKDPQHLADLIRTKLGASLSPMYPHDVIVSRDEDNASIKHVRTTLTRNEQEMPVLDITVRNNSDSVCVITEARALVVDHWHIGQVWLTPRALAVSFEYDLGISGGAGTYHSSALSQELRPQTGDRFSLVLGPVAAPRQWYPAVGQFLFLLKISLVYNESQKVVELPTVFAQLPPPWKISGISSHGIPDGALAEQYRLAIQARQAAERAEVVDQRAIATLNKQISALESALR